MAVTPPFNIKKWIAENKDLLKPPVGNACLYKQAKDFIVMIVGGPNSRKDYHFNETEELFYQLQGNIVVKIIDDGEPKDIYINEGDMFLLPACTPHSPQRGENTIGLVIEKVRKTEEDGFMWFCENCGNILHQKKLIVTDIVSQLPPIMNDFYNNQDKRICNKCGSTMQPPIKK